MWQRREVVGTMLAVPLAHAIGSELRLSSMPFSFTMSDDALDTVLWYK